MASVDGRRQYLDSMGIRLWRLRAADAAPDSAVDPASVVPEVIAAPVVALDTSTAEPAPAPASIPAPLSTQSGAPVGQAPEPAVPMAADTSGEWPDWETLQQAVAGCTRCALHQGRNRTVFGVGDPAADWMIIGEAPGADEDRLGEPFVGRAGRLLDQMLKAVGRSRERVFIANILKCRPPRNRDPSGSEAACCRAYLDRQIELVQPRVIMAVGRIAAHNLLGTDRPMRELRGRLHQYRSIPVVVSYHPAYLLRSPAEKRKAWEDLKRVCRVLSGGE